ncbi:MAG: ABC transporter substrate-binding protein [Planctomycetota bacterium]|nr:MAG: ABC transporter substrate-binding protein [Planctomycetota bacterium]
MSGQQRVLLALLSGVAVLAAACSRVGDLPPPKPADYRRVVVLGPSTTETLLALDLGPRVVGVSDWCPRSTLPAAQRIGGLGNPNLELLTRLGPDLVLAQGQNPTLASWCESMGVPFKGYSTDSWEGWAAEVLSLGELFSCRDRAVELLQDKRRQLHDLRGNLPGDWNPPTVLLVVSRSPGRIAGLLAAGPPSFLSELLAAAGGRNALAEADQAYLDLNGETVLALDPDFIFELQPAEAGSITVWQRDHPELRAVRTGRVVPFREEFITHPGPKMTETARLFQSALLGNR